MKKGITILLVSMYLLTTTGLGQLINLPQLIVHFYNHKKQNQDLSLWSYLALHYNAKTDNDGDDKEDSKLPFKTINNAYFYNIATNDPISSINTPPPLAFLICKSQHAFNTDFNQLLISRNIWHPPQSSIMI